MNTTRILTQSQAEAVYSAMCALNKVGAVARKVEIDELVVLSSARGAAGSVIIQRKDGTGWPECHDSQSAFAAAYGLDHDDEWQSAVAAAAGGLTQTAIER